MHTNEPNEHFQNHQTQIKVNKIPQSVKANENGGEKN